MVKPSNKIAIAGIHSCENNKFIGECNKGMQVNTMQKTIKNSIIVGLGFIRCLRNIVFSKNS